MVKLKVFEMFAGYGGASFALKKTNIEHEIVGFSEIDKYAIRCYEQNHKGKNFGDCTKINPCDLEDFDLLTGGFPCQSFSVAGKGLGEIDPRGTLFYEIIRIAEVKKPKYILLENVKGLTNKPHKQTFDKILSELDRIGYNVYWKVLNSKNYGIPQSRARVWFVCFRKDIEHKFEWPQPTELKIFIKDILEEQVADKYYLSKEQTERLLNKSERNLKERFIDKEYSQTLCARDYKDPKIICLNNEEYLNNRVYGTEGVSPTLNVKESKDVKILDLYNHKVKEDGVCITPSEPHHNNLRIYNPYNGKNSETEVGTIGTSVGSATGKTAQLLISNTIRKLTPKECFRLMGFLNDEINLEGLSNTQKYKLAGNGWDINIVSKIFEMMLK